MVWPCTPSCSCCCCGSVCGCSSTNVLFFDSSCNLISESNNSFNWPDKLSISVWTSGLNTSSDWLSCFLFLSISYSKDTAFVWVFKVYCSFFGFLSK